MSNRVPTASQSLTLYVAVSLVHVPSTGTFGTDGNRRRVRLLSIRVLSGAYVVFCRPTYKLTSSFSFDKRSSTSRDVLSSIPRVLRRTGCNLPGEGRNRFIVNYHSSIDRVRSHERTEGLLRVRCHEDEGICLWDGFDLKI